MVSQTRGLRSGGNCKYFCMSGGNGTEIYNICMLLAAAGRKFCGFANPRATVMILYEILINFVCLAAAEKKFCVFVCF